MQESAPFGRRGNGTATSDVKVACGLWALLLLSAHQPAAGGAKQQLSSTGRGGWIPPAAGVEPSALTELVDRRSVEVCLTAGRELGLAVPGSAEEWHWAVAAASC